MSRLHELVAMTALSLGCGPDPVAPAPEEVVTPNCDLQALETSARLPERPRRQRALDVTRGLVEACGDHLSPTVRRALSATAEAVAEGRQPTPIEQRGAPESGWAAVLERGCPELREVLADVANVPEGRRTKALFEACRYARYEVLDDAEVTRQPYSGPLLWSVHQFVLEQGLAEPLARSITRSLFDLWYLASQPHLLIGERSLPQAAPGSGRALRADDVLLILTAEELRLAMPAKSPTQARTTTVVATRATLTQSWDRKHERLGLLYSALLAAGIDQNPGAGGEVRGPDAVLVADQDTPFRVVFRVLMTLKQVDLRWFGVMIDHGLELEPRVLELGPPSRSVSALFPAFAVSIKSTGFSFTHRVDLPIHDGIPVLNDDSAGARYDYDALAAVASERRTRADEPSRVRLVGERRIPLQVVTRTVEALRGPGCDPLAATGCVYSRVALEMER